MWSAYNTVQYSAVQYSTVQYRTSRIPGPALVASSVAASSTACFPSFGSCTRCRAARQPDTLAGGIGHVLRPKAGIRARAEGEIQRKLLERLQEGAGQGPRRQGLQKV